MVTYKIITNKTKFESVRNRSTHNNVSAKLLTFILYSDENDIAHSGVTVYHVLETLPGILDNIFENY